MICCSKYECLECYLITCAETIELPIVSDVDETLHMVYEFNGTAVRTDIEAEAGQFLVVPNTFNENYSYKIAFYKSDGSLLNDTCYILKTMNTIFTNPPQPITTTSGKFQFIGAIGQTTFQHSDLEGVDTLIVTTEKGTMYEGLDYDQYRFDPVGGIITFNQSVEGQEVTIVWLKTVQ